MSDQNSENPELEPENNDNEAEEAKEVKERKKRIRGTNNKKKPLEDHETSTKGERIFSLFLSGLPYDCDEVKIREFFGKPESIVNIVLPKYQDTGRCIGYSHVEFNRKNDFEEGLKLNKNKLGGRYIDIAPSKGKSAKQVVQKQDPPFDCKTVFVGNLPYDITEDQVGDKFRKFGEIDMVRFAWHRTTNKFKGKTYQ
jgi:RNA recognition motif-containing protein